MDTNKAIKLAIENVKKEGLTDIFPRPYEVDFLNNESFSKKIFDEVKSRINANTLQGLKVEPIQHVFFPKKEPFDFRRAALMQPIDTITYLALVLKIADEVEKKRPALRNKYVYSYRFKPSNGLLFCKKYNYTAFDKHAREAVKKPRTKVLVKCDISNFYDKLNLHRLESSLLGISAEKQTVKLINELLLFWANRDSYGLPIGGNASRILAEAFLLPIDEYLISHKIKFCRFVDDYRFFAPNVELAHAWLTLFVERLFLEGLSINPAKTFLEDAARKDHHSDKGSGAKKFSEQGKTTKIISGYSGTIPTKFRELSEKETNELSQIDLDALILGISDKPVITPEEVRHLLRVLVAVKRYEKLPLVISDISKRFPQFTPVMLDLAIKKKEDISESTKIEIRNYFSDRLKDCGHLPEYILISIVRLLGEADYQAKESLLDSLRNLKRNSGAFIGRCLIDALYGITMRNDVIEIRRLFDRADSWERCAIIRLVQKHLPEDEKRPWEKNVKVRMTNDPFAMQLLDPEKLKKKKVKPKHSTP